MDADPRRIVDRYWSRFCSATLRPLGSAGGLSGARFWRLFMGSDELLLRRWPMEHPPRVQLRAIHQVLQHAWQRRITYVPVPLETSRGETFADNGGHLWELTPWLPGIADYHTHPNDSRLAAAMIALARFHRATADFGAPSVAATAPAIDERLRRLEQLGQHDLAQLRAAVAAAAPSERKSVAERFLESAPEVIPTALAGLVPLAGRFLPLQPSIRDIWHDHVLFTGDEVTGLVDFGALRIDTPATDVARLLGSLAGDQPQQWIAGLNAYQTERMLSPDERSAVAALDLAATLLGGCNWIRWTYLERRRFDSPEIVEMRLSALLARLEYASRHGPVGPP